MSWVLTIDFGTTNTVAAVGDAAGSRALTIDGSPVMASAVFLMEDGNWIVGDAAIRLARRRLDRFEACPKRAIADGSLFLGGADIPITEAITALFRPIVTEALQQHGGRPPDLFLVTHPATWTATRVDVLLAAAAAATAGTAGKVAWPRPRALTEPAAAAQRVLHIEGVPAIARLVVLDLGGGTTDVTVVDRHGDRLTIVGQPMGREGLGGTDFDLRLARWMTAEVNVPGLYDSLAAAADPELRERAVDIRTHARDVKEQLSRQPVVPAQLPKSPPELMENTPVQVSRTRLEELIHGSDQEPGLEQAVELVNDALRAAPPGPELAGVFLVGGSSRIPLLGVLVGQRVGCLPITHGDPTTAVAEGAAYYAWGVLQAEQAQAAQAAQPFSTPPTEQFPPITPPPFPHGYPQQPQVPPGNRRTRTRVALLVILLLVLVGGGIFTYAMVNSGTAAPNFVCPDGSMVTNSSDCPTQSPDPTTDEPITDVVEPSTEDTYEVYTLEIIGTIGVFESPYLDSYVMYMVHAGDTVDIVCTTRGDFVDDNDRGVSNDLWDGIDGGGFVPDVAVATGTDLPTMPSC